MTKCNECVGTGVVPILVGFDDDLDEFACPDCNGTGEERMKVTLVAQPGRNNQEIKNYLTANNSSFTDNGLLKANISPDMLVDLEKMAYVSYVPSEYDNISIPTLE